MNMVAAAIQQDRESKVWELMDERTTISDEELVELVFEHFDITAAEAIGRLERFNAAKARQSMRFE